MTSDEMEAESRKYSNDGVMFLPLSSGKIAIFNRSFQRDRIIESPMILDLIRSVKPVETRKPVAPTRPTFNPDIELDL
jgi:hypothetical protein